MEIPGATIYVANAGIKDRTLDLLVVGFAPGTTVAGVFTQSRFAGPSVILSREVVAGGTARGLVVVSKNANVANGDAGDRDALELQGLAAAAIGCRPDEVVVASTGVIGRRYPAGRLASHFAGLPWPPGAPATIADAAAAIMTTDTRAKVVSASAGPATVTGIAKGVGMIEPDMATLLTFVFTDALVEAGRLDEMWRRVVSTTFNALSIDTDTSTSDSAVVFATGLAGAVDPPQLETALHDVALGLVRMIAADGEGATRTIDAVVTGARDQAQAKRVAKAIVNSPLVKTAVHGSDPNWGRLAMAVGKVADDDIDPDRVRLGIGDVQLYPTRSDEALDRAAAHMAGDAVLLWADLGIADGGFTAFGCDLTDGYIRINADYTT